MPFVNGNVANAAARFIENAESKTIGLTSGV